MSEGEQVENVSEWTDKQKLFVEKYFELGLNGARAARAAGYSSKTARQIASENLSKPYIRAEIDRRLSEQAMSRDGGLAQLAHHGRGDMRDFIGKSSTALARHPDGSLIKKFKRTVTTTTIDEKVSQSEEKIELELYDAQAALVHIGRYHKLFIDRTDLTSDEMPIAINFFKTEGRAPSVPSVNEADDGAE